MNHRPHPCLAFTPCFDPRGIRELAVLEHVSQLSWTSDSVLGGGSIASSSIIKNLPAPAKTEGPRGPIAPDPVVEERPVDPRGGGRRGPVSAGAEAGAASFSQASTVPAVADVLPL